jgi:hypothetical protein
MGKAIKIESFYMGILFKITQYYVIDMNSSDDTVYYLYKGFKIIAIEADPSPHRFARYDRHNA